MLAANPDGCERSHAQPGEALRRMHARDRQAAGEELRVDGMSASGPKRTCRDVCYLSAFGGKADIDERSRFMSTRPNPHAGEIYFIGLAIRRLAELRHELSPAESFRIGGQMRDAADVIENPALSLLPNPLADLRTIETTGRGCCR